MKIKSCLWTSDAFITVVSAPAGTMFDRLQVICTHKQDLQDWVEHLSRQIKHAAATAPSHKPLTVPCHTVGNQSLNTHLQTIFFPILSDVKPKYRPAWSDHALTVNSWWSGFRLTVGGCNANSDHLVSFFSFRLTPSRPLVMLRVRPWRWLPPTTPFLILPPTEHLCPAPWCGVH